MLVELGTRLKNRDEKAAASQNFLLAAKAQPSLPDAWAEAMPYSRNGHSGYQILWNPAVAEMLKEAAGASQSSPRSSGWQSAKA